MDAVRDGRPEELAELFRRHRDRALAVAEGMVGDRSRAEDAVQEAFLRVLRYRKSWRGEARFGTWLYRILRNLIVDEERRRDRREARARRAARMLPPSKASEPELPDPRVEALREALSRLPGEKREVLVLRSFEDLPYREIGRICGISEGAARVRAHRALEELRGLWREQEEVSDAM